MNINFTVFHTNVLNAITELLFFKLIYLNDVLHLCTNLANLLIAKYYINISKLNFINDNKYH